MVHRLFLSFLAYSSDHMMELGESSLSRKLELERHSLIMKISSKKDLLRLDSIMFYFKNAKTGMVGKALT